MVEREGLIAAIAAAPDDDTSRLILADWLDEHDDPLSASSSASRWRWSRCESRVMSG